MTSMYLNRDDMSVPFLELVQRQVDLNTTIATKYSEYF